MKKNGANNIDEIFMARAIALAKRGFWNVSSNPMVGAVLVKNGKIISEGFHRAHGEAHAEIMAINGAAQSLEGALLYISLEPCCHYGRTPPCTTAIIKSKIGKVVMAVLDPNPLVAGKGRKILQDAGIETVVGILEKDARSLNERFFKFMETGMPFTTLKVAQSLDGRIATASGDSRWITSLPARRYAHRLRGANDAILVGIGTIKSDDPHLTCRLVKGRNPVRVVVDSRLSIPLESRVLRGQDEAKTIIVATKNVDKKKMDKLMAMGVEVLIIPAKNGRVNIAGMLSELGKKKISSLLVEGGAEIATAFLREGLVDKIMVFIAPKIIGNGIDTFGDLDVKKITDCHHLEWTKQKKIGEDILLEGHIQQVNAILQSKNTS